MGEYCHIPNTDSEPGKARWLAKGNPEEMPHISKSNYHGSMTLWAHPCVYPHVLFFFFPKWTLCWFHYLLCLCGNSFLQNQRARALSLATGLVARIQHSHYHGLTAVSGWKLKPCFKPLQTKATWDWNEPESLWSNARADSSVNF